MEKLTRAILEAEADAYRDQAVAIGRKIRSEAGIVKAIRLIENFSNQFHSQQL